jgi:acyl-[acyl-carrier-protein] desaturase
MPQPDPETAQLHRETYQLFRDYFEKAERKRRWSVDHDVPWDRCNRALNPAIADVVETFCAVELYLPDYLSKLIPQVRADRGRSWMLANWGYEECKHSMAFEDWLLRSGARTEERVEDMHRGVFAHEWHLPYDSAVGMVCYTTLQELATRVHYTRLREAVRREGGCPALERALQLVATDEAAHADFFRRMVGLYLKHDRAGTLEQIRRVINTFQMPAVHMLTESHRRKQQVLDLNVFSEPMFFELVLEPVLTALGVTRQELRRKTPRETVLLTGSASAP